MQQLLVKMSVSIDKRGVRQAVSRETMLNVPHETRNVKNSKNVSRETKGATLVVNRDYYVSEMFKAKQVVLDQKKR